MVFSSVIFLFYFIPVVLLFYFVLPKKYRNACLLLFSIIFYAWGEPKFVFVLLLSIMMNYFSGLGVARFKGMTYAKVVLFLSIVINIGILFFFKYANFSINVLDRVLYHIFGVWPIIPIPYIALPIGLSFFTFQGLSYVIDVYRGSVPAQRNPLHIALYISLFPQLVAGPIVRYADIYTEIQDRTSTLDDISIGTQRFIIGLSKKVMIADILSAVADSIFSMPVDQLEVSTAWLGAICYSFQIYFDFSGYSDMAIGIGRIIGFHFLENFNLPYISTSVTEFWRRWHISLSSWFRDYLYIPLGGNRHGNVYVNLFIVFFCTGMWHGAAFTFLFWGLWHGFFLIIERIGKRHKWTIPAPKAMQWLYTMLVVILGWVLFRSDSISHTISYVQAMMGICSDEFRPYGLAYYLDNQVMFTLVLATIISLGIPARILKFLEHRSTLLIRSLRYLYIPGLWFLLVVSMCMIVNGNYSPFIYFRF